MNEGYVERDLARLNPFMFLLRSAYLEEGSGVYYRFGTRLIDHVILRINEQVWFGHLYQVVGHATSSALLFFLVWYHGRRNYSAALIAATIFALHPATSGAVVLAAVRWNISIGLLFLSLITVYTLLWHRPLTRNLKIVFCLLSLPMFLLATVAEIGALAMGTIGLWLAFSCWQKHDKKWAKAVLTPLAFVPITYLIIRRVALGKLAAPYVENPSSLTERLALYGRNFVYDLNLYLSPLRWGGIESLLDSKSQLIVGAIIVLLLLVSVCFTAWRYSEFTALPVIGFLAYCIFQMNSLWLIPKAPISVLGIERGYVYYFSLANVAMLLGLFLAAIFREESRRHREPIYAAALVIVLALMTINAATMDRWRSGARLIATHQATLQPFLRTVDAKTPIYAEGFPYDLREPWQPHILIYYFTTGIILSEWAGKPLNISFLEKTGPMSPSFEGYLIRADRVGGITITEREKFDWPAYYKRFNVQPLQLWGDGSNVEVDLYNVVRDDTASPPNLKATSPDPAIGWSPQIDLQHYSLMELRIQLLGELDGAPISAQLYFGVDSQGLSETRSIIKPIESTNEMQVIQFEIGALEDWRTASVVNYLRLDPIDRKYDFQIESVIMTNPD